VTISTAGTASVAGRGLAPFTPYRSTLGDFRTVANATARRAAGVGSRSLVTINRLPEVPVPQPRYVPAEQEQQARDLPSDPASDNAHLN
jgi:hypothetical protein